MTTLPNVDTNKLSESLQSVFEACTANNSLAFAYSTRTNILSNLVEAFGIYQKDSVYSSNLHAYEWLVNGVIIHFYIDKDSVNNYWHHTLIIHTVDQPTMNEYRHNYITWKMLADLDV